MRRTLGILVGVVVLFAPVLVMAQQPAQSFEQLKVLVKTGETIWLTDNAGNESRGRLTELGTDGMTLEIDGQPRTWEASQVRRVRHRHSDSLVNGTVIGAATGGAIYAGFDALWCSEHDDCSGGEVAASVAFGAGVGAGIGVLIDSVMKARRTVYESPAAGSSASIAVVPAISAGRMALQLNVRF